MHPELAKMIALQQEDVALRGLREEMTALPKHVASLAAHSAAAQASLLKMEEDLKREEAQRRREESEVRDQQEKIARVRRHLDTATTTVQVTAYEHEIQFAEAQIAKLEDAELESMERTEKLELERRQAVEAVVDSEAALERERLHVAEILDRDKAEAMKHEARRTELRRQIDEGMLGNYDRIAKAKGTALAEGVDHKCSACQMMVRPQKWNELRDRMSDTDMMSCDSCGRLLYWDPARDAPAKKGVEVAGDAAGVFRARDNNRRMRKRICVDMDDVVADTLGEHLARYNRDHGERITAADLMGTSLREIVAAERREAVEAYFHTEEFFEDLPVMPESQRVLKALQERYEIFIATAAMSVPNSFPSKFRWLRRHFPFIAPSHIVFCGEKRILRADYLIDDNPGQLRQFEGEGILYNAPHNAGVTGFRRVKDWLEVEQMFLAPAVLR